MRVVTLISGTSAFKQAKWTCDINSILVGLHGNDEFVVSENPAVVDDDWDNSNIPAETQLLLRFHIDVGQTGAKPQFGYLFPIEKDRTIFVAFSSNGTHGQLYLN